MLIELPHTIAALGSVDVKHVCQGALKWDRNANLLPGTPIGDTLETTPGRRDGIAGRYDPAALSGSTGLRLFRILRSHWARLSA